jgi:nicotinate-nucleotide adenylyltransferase
VSAPGERVGVLGGTFDPVHVGHLAAAVAARDAFGLHRVLLVPSRQPPHRAESPQASAFHRFAMVSLAVASNANLVASDMELLAPGPSFTAATLRQLHAAGCPPQGLFFITGTDAFAEIATWHDYPTVLDLAHFVVISRPGQSCDALRQRLPTLASRMHVLDATGGGQPQGAGPHIFLVDAATPDVSSTDIRERAARGDSLAGLVPPGVAGHIRKHGLYGCR